MSPLIKVCGMTEAENIRNVELQGVDMIGFNLLPQISPLSVPDARVSASLRQACRRLCQRK